MTSSQHSTAKLLQLAAQDNVAVSTAALQAGTIAAVSGAGGISLRDAVAVGHKVAIRDIAAGEKIIKFGCPIGSATRAISIGEHVHTHNLKSDYLPTFTLDGDRKFLKD
jgi:hypothetical protein